MSWRRRTVPDQVLSLEYLHDLRCVEIQAVAVWQWWHYIKAVVALRLRPATTELWIGSEIVVGDGDDDERRRR